MSFRASWLRVATVVSCLGFVVPASAQGNDDDGWSTVERPDPMSVGLGLGTTINGNSIFEPNAASARFVLSDTLQLEPLVNLGVSGGTGTDPSADLLIGAQGRFVMGTRGPVDLQILGGASFSHAPNGAATVTQFNISYGLSLVWWMAKQWSFSIDANNPLLTLQTVSPDNEDIDNSTSYTVGVTWNPSLTAMVHMYF